MSIVMLCPGPIDNLVSSKESLVFAMVTMVTMVTIAMIVAVTKPATVVVTYTSIADVSSNFSQK